MLKIKRRLKWIWIGLLITSLIYAGSYLFLYINKDEQANRYRSTILPNNFEFSFSQKFEEIYFKTPHSGLLNALLFKSPHSKGVVCFWKGNGGTLNNWGLMAPTFLQYNYDVLITDYRQHGKSKGGITLANFYSDAQTVYDSLKKRYPESVIIICGYSLGGRIAAHLAANNTPKLTLLLDPASAGGDFSDRVTETLFSPLPSVTGFVFPTKSDVAKARSPIVVVSTDNPHSVAYQLKTLLTQKDEFVAIPGATHETLLTHSKTQQTIAHVLR
ncbi:hypothetical protein GCM10023189_37250 [Nibrella saemangeumensis]|uniref:Serine aminopeptidase S33 domain-containing protein n=1 Tax=Nibrella saemangeumensis TaxID=1084526 RepID=A0ABP8N8C3_9BACT